MGLAIISFSNLHRSTCKRISTWGSRAQRLRWGKSCWRRPRTFPSLADSLASAGSPWMSFPPSQLWHWPERKKWEWATKSLKIYFFSFDVVNHGLIVTSFTIRDPHALLGVWKFGKMRLLPKKVRKKTHHRVWANPPFSAHRRGWATDSGLWGFRWEKIQIKEESFTRVLFVLASLLHVTGHL